MTGTGSQWLASGGFYVGRQGNGTLNVQDGGLVENYDAAYIGYFSGSSGTATVTGSGSQWNTYTEFYIGYGSNGTLNVQDGGSVLTSINASIGYNSGSSGTATVTGAGSQWTVGSELRVGTAGNSTGTLTVQDGGLLQNQDGYTYIGYVENSTGTLTVQSGGRVQSYVASIASGSIGTNSTGMATVSGAGSQWSVIDTMVVGEFGSGSLNVQNGGLVQVSFGGLYVGYRGNGTLTVESGGQVESGFGVIGDEAGSTGIVIVTGTGSKWTMTNGLNVGNSGTGTLTLSDGGQVQAGSVSVGSIGTLAGSGTVGGSVTVNSGGTIRAGNGGGTLSLTSHLTLQSGATVGVAVNDSSSATSSNFLSITGGATISSGTKVVIDGTGAAFATGTPYSYQIASGAGDQQLLNITNQLQFSTIGFGNAGNFTYSLTGTIGGNVYVNFTPVPVPEPAAVLGLSVAVLGVRRLVLPRMRPPVSTGCS